MKRWFAILFVGLAVTNTGLAQNNPLIITVSSENHEYRNTPLCVPLSLSPEWAKFDEVVVFVDVDEDRIKSVGQLTAPGILTESIKPAKEGLVRRDLHVIIPHMKAKKTGRVQVHFEKTDPQVTRFAWTQKKGEYAELILTRSGTFTPYLRYVNNTYDTSSKDAREKSYKVFHHLYDPAGKRFVTNGGFADDNVADPKKLLYPHHRGIMYGFMKCSYGPGLKKKADTWHCTGDAHVAHRKTLSSEAGPVLGRHRVLLGWHGEKNDLFAEEERELTVYHIPGGTLVEFASRLKTTGGNVRIDGDPQHAGFQFRATNDIADKKIAAQTYYLRPDGKGKLDETRNWDPKTKKGPVDLPWDALCFLLGDQRYTVCYLNNATNPKETRFSERNYGRFGGYFEYDLTESNPLTVNYRLWLQNGEMTTEQVAALYTAFVTPPRAVVK